MPDTLRWGQYEFLRPDEIEQIRERRPIAFLPWGALEWHSYHAPVGLDGLKAHGLCKAIAAETGGVVLPPVYVGTDTIKPFKGFAHSIEHPPETVTALCVQFLEQLADEKFEILVVLTGHYGGGHIEAIQAASTQFKASHPEVGLWAFPDSEPLKGHYQADHAGPVETSFQLHYAPGPVDLSRLPNDREVTLDDDGIWGKDPRTATAEQGAKMEKLIIAVAKARINEMIKERQQ